MYHRIGKVGLALLTMGLLLLSIPGPQAASAAGSDTQPPTVPHLFVIRGTGGCETTLNIHLSTDNVDPQSAILYEVLINGTLPPGHTLHATSTRNGNGILYPVFGLPHGGVQRFTVVAVDTAGNASAPSNAVSHNFGGLCD